MNIALAILIMTAPFALAAALTWAAHRSGVLRLHLDQFRISAPMTGRLFADDRWADRWSEGRDFHRAMHDADAIRTRFEQHPTWPSSGAVGERR